VKQDGEGRVKWFRGWLVAQGLTQKYGDKFFSCCPFFSLHTLLAFAAEKK